MKVAIMQPYFLPYLGYFSLIKQTDQFILFDPVQFIKHGWIERNRILSPKGEPQYIAIPLEKHSQSTLIKDIRIRNQENWKEKIKAQLVHYKKRAPYYNDTMAVIDKILNYETDSIVKMNQYSLKCICEYLGIEADFPIFSEMGLTIETPHAPDEWALNICKAMGNVEEYWNPIGGASFFDKSKYDDAGIDLKFEGVNLNFYSQRRGPENFVPGLSIIDVMMFNPPEKINEMLDDYYFLTNEQIDEKKKVLVKK